MNRLLAACFVCSGASALAFEMLWMRSASLVAGGTAATTATVLAVYFAGLGIGAAWARNGTPSPVRRYGRLELGAAIGGAWSLAVFTALASDAGMRALAVGGPAGALLAVAVAILPSTICFGATLPALAPALAGARAAGAGGAGLYAANTAGGAVGVAVAGFGLPIALGVRGSYLAAIVTSAVAGCAALAIVRHMAPLSPSRPVRVTPPRRLRVAAAGVGALGIGLEVLWTRLFAQVLHNSVYSFTAVALVFLVAIACGAVLSAWAMERMPPARVAATALIAAGAATSAGWWLFVHLTGGLGYVGMETGLGEYLLRIAALVAVTAGPAALAGGAVLPALWAAWGADDARGAARPLGDLAAANTAGAVVGAVAAGFVVVPAIGLRGGMLLAAVASIVLADVVAPVGGRLRPLAWAMLLAIVVANPLRAPLVTIDASTERLQHVYEGATGVVSVVDARDDLQLRLDNWYVLGGSAARANERRQGLLPLLLHPDPQRVAFIGLATGITASAAPALDVPDTTVVELVPEVVTAAGEFAAWNDDLLARDDVRIVVDDGRRWAASADGTWDVVVADLFVPWHAGAGTLYTREMYDAVARRLAPGGVFCQWLPLYQLTRDEFDVIARTFVATFPEAQLWRNDFYPDRPIVALVGAAAPLDVDVERVRARLDRMPAWAADPLLATPGGLAMLYAGDLHAGRALIADGALNADDRPLVEFRAPRLTRIGASGDKDWFTGAAFADFVDALDAQAMRDPFPTAAGEIRDARRAGRAMARYALATASHDADAASRWQAEVRSLVPALIAAADAAPPERALDALRAEQADVRRELERMERRLATLGDED